MKYIKLYEDLDFPNDFPSFKKLIRDIKDITIELKDNGFKILPFEVDNFDDSFDNFDFFVRIYRPPSSMNNYGFSINEVKEYIEMMKDYIDNYYTYKNLVVFYDGTKLIPKPTERITQVEIEISEIKNK
jgi:hypothetical protein